MTITAVVELTYRVVSDTPFDAPPPVPVRDVAGVFSLADNVLRVRPPTTHSVVSEARDAVEPFLRAWELEAELRYGFPVFVFEFAGADIVGSSVTDADEAQPAASSRRVEAESDQFLEIAWSRFPDPPTIRVSPEMVDIWSRFKYARMGLREPLQSCAYYCLTVIERSAGGRQQAATRYRIDLSVLRKLGELTSSRASSAPRKAAAHDSPELTREEKRWIDHAIRLSLLQMGLEHAGASSDDLTMSELPPL